MAPLVNYIGDPAVAFRRRKGTSIDTSAHDQLVSFAVDRGYEPWARLEPPGHRRLMLIDDLEGRRQLEAHGIEPRASNDREICCHLVAEKIRERPLAPCVRPGYRATVGEQRLRCSRSPATFEDPQELALQDNAPRALFRAWHLGDPDAVIELRVDGAAHRAGPPRPQEAAVLVEQAVQQECSSWSASPNASRTPRSKS